MSLTESQIREITPTKEYFSYITNNPNIIESISEIFRDYPTEEAMGINTDTLAIKLGVDKLFMEVSLSIWHRSPCTFYKYGVINYDKDKGIWFYDNNKNDKTDIQPLSYDVYNIKELKDTNHWMQTKLNELLELCQKQQRQIDYLENTLMSQ